LVNFAVIGTGAIGKLHSQTINTHSGANLVAQCDPEYSNKVDTFVPIFADIQAMLTAFPYIDVVSICTPNGMHASHAIQCMKAGKHVIIEKPLCLSRKEADLIIFTALQHHVKVFCVMQNRFTPVAGLLKRLITTQKLGDILEMNMFLSWNRGSQYFASTADRLNWHGTAELDGGPLFTQFSHFIDLIYWLFGDIKVLSAARRNLNHDYVSDIEDCGSVTFEFAEKALGNLHYSINAPIDNITSSVTITGTQGAISIEGQYLERIKYYKTTSDVEIPILEEQLQSGHFLTIDNVIQSLENDNSINTNALEGLKVVEIIEKIYNF